MKDLFDTVVSVTRPKQESKEEKRVRKQALKQERRVSISLHAPTHTLGFISSTNGCICS